MRRKVRERAGSTAGSGSYRHTGAAALHSGPPSSTRTNQHTHAPRQSPAHTLHHIYPIYPPVIESPVCTPIGSTFSMEHTIMQLSFRSRITSNSNSFQPISDCSTSTCGGVCGCVVCCVWWWWWWESFGVVSVRRASDVRQFTWAVRPLPPISYHTSVNTRHTKHREPRTYNTSYTLPGPSWWLKGKVAPQK